MTTICPGVRAVRVWRLQLQFDCAHIAFTDIHLLSWLPHHSSIAAGHGRRITGQMMALSGIGVKWQTTSQFEKSATELWVRAAQCVRLASTHSLARKVLQLSLIGSKALVSVYLDVCIQSIKLI